MIQSFTAQVAHSPSAGHAGGGCRLTRDFQLAPSSTMGTELRSLPTSLASCLLRTCNKQMDSVRINGRKCSLYEGNPILSASQYVSLSISFAVAKIPWRLNIPSTILPLMLGIFVKSLAASARLCSLSSTVFCYKSAMSNTPLMMDFSDSPFLAGAFYVKDKFPLLLDVYIEIRVHKTVILLIVVEADCQHPIRTPMAPAGARPPSKPINTAKTTSADPKNGPDPPPDDGIVKIASKGDVVLRVTFLTSKEAIRAAKRSLQPRPGQRPPASATQQQQQPVPLQSPKVTYSYRADLGVLKKHSEYFRALLDEAGPFTEARQVAHALEALTLRGVKPADVDDVEELPTVEITDDDDATRSAHRHSVFADLLRILHGAQATTKPPTMLYVVTLAVLADRFDCVTPVSRYLSSELKFKWPASKIKAGGRDDENGIGGPRLENEEVLRQRILAAWLLDQPLKLHAATRELIMYGSKRWIQASADQDDDGYEETLPSWWDLPDDLEHELQLRRECILDTLASVQRHFLSLYSSRTQVCRLGYDSSPACDSFQLGQMVKFLAHKKLLFFVDFSSASLGTIEDSATTDIGHIISLLSQVTSYQIDRNHTNCGLRIKILPIVEYIKSMLSSNVISIPRSAWKKNRAATSWMPSAEDAESKEDGNVFRYTRSVAGDQRLRFEGAMASDRMARELFTAKSWDWTPEG
ncbi:hypothetical protein M0657_001029 [Pyricularia oryzae]|nr:hypothetical protein M0657_001029 [Pyricularia oryzae]